MAQCRERFVHAGERTGSVCSSRASVWAAIRQLSFFLLSSHPPRPLFSNVFCKFGLDSS
jgi:hypothetical protein